MAHCLYVPKHSELEPDSVIPATDGSIAGNLRFGRLTSVVWYRSGSSIPSQFRSLARLESKKAEMHIGTASPAVNDKGAPQRGRRQQPLRAAMSGARQCAGNAASFEIFEIKPEKTY